MTNHVHLLAVADKADSLANAIGNAHRAHSRIVNGQRGWTGHLWANRFYSTPLDDYHLWAAVPYVELNPVRAGIVSRATDYRWSSARAHAGKVRDRLLAPDRPFPGSVGNWGKWLKEGDTTEDFDKIRRNTNTGRPTGSQQFTQWLERCFSRPLAPAKRGRPKRKRKR